MWNGEFRPEAAAIHVLDGHEVYDGTVIDGLRVRSFGNWHTSVPPDFQAVRGEEPTVFPTKRGPEDLDRLSRMPGGGVEMAAIAPACKGNDATPWTLVRTPGLWRGGRWWQRVPTRVGWPLFARCRAGRRGDDNQQANECLRLHP